MIFTQEQWDGVDATSLKMDRGAYDEITPEEFYVFLNAYDIGDFFENPELEAQLLKRYGVECGCKRCLGQL